MISFDNELLSPVISAESTGPVFSDVNGRDSRFCLMLLQNSRPILSREGSVELYMPIDASVTMHIIPVRNASDAMDMRKRN